MKVKIFVGLAVLAALFALKSVKAPATYADFTIKLQGQFVNSGVIPVNVWYYYTYRNNTGGRVQFYPPSGTQPIFVTAGTTGYGTNATVPDIPGQVNQPFEVTWGSDCYDPTAVATYSGVTSDAFNFVATVDVTCPAAPSGLVGSCDANNNLSFSWNNTPHTQFDVNVNDTIDGEGGPTDTYHLKTAANSYSRSGQAGRTYTWWVHTLYNSIWSAATNGNTITCVNNVLPPEPTRNPPTQVCNGSNVNVTFSWNAVSGATAYRLDIWDPNGVWTGNSHEGGGPTGWAYQDTGGSTSWTWWNFLSNSGQTWTARAFRDGLWSDIATWDGFTTIDCRTVVPPTNATGAAACPFASLVVNFAWAEGSGSNETNYDIEVSTSSTFGTKSTKRLAQNVTRFYWTSANPMDSGSPLTPDYSTAYYARIRAYNSTTNLYSTYVNFSLFPISGLPDGSCSAPKVKLKVFADLDADGVYDGASEDFNNGINPEFSASVATIVQTDNSVDSDITSNIRTDGTRTGDVTAGTFAYYKITVASNWVLTNYVSDKLPLASPPCIANPCAYSALSPPATGRWISAVNQVWDLKLGMRSTTSTMNVTVFYDKDSDGVVDAGENFTTNPTFGTSVAQIIENGGPYFEQDRTGSFTSAGVLSPAETVNSGSMRQFKVVPAVGWVLTYYRSDRTTQQLTTCSANTACTYNQGWTRSYTTTGGETFNFWLGINTAVPANPGAGPPGTGDCNGTTLSVTLTWADNATFETGYFLEVYSNSSYTTLVGNKVFAANTRTFTWKNPGTASEKLDNGVAPAYGARYWWRIRAVNYSSVSLWVYPTSNGVGTTIMNNNPASMPASFDCTPPAAPFNLVVSSSCSSGIVTVNFSFTVNATNESGYIIDVSTGGNATTWASTWGGKYLNAGQTSFTWKNTAVESDLLSFPDSDPNTTGNQIAPTFGTTYRWRVVAYNSRNIQSNHTYPFSTATPTGTAFTTPSLASCSPPPALSGLSVTPSCIGSGNRETQLAFAWNKETSAVDYMLDVSTSSSFQTLASKVITQPVSGSSVVFVWNETGAGNIMDSGAPLRPIPNAGYYWRVQGRNANGNGAYTYPTPASVTAFVCIPDIDISLGSGNPTSMEQNTPQTFNFVINNNSSIAQTVSVGFWPEGPNTTPPIPNCPSSPQIPPTASQRQTVVVPAATTTPGTVTVSFTFTANNQPANYTAYAYASYDCAVSEDPSTWNNNKTSQTYNVFARTWFETQGGDVGARNGTISVSRSGKVVSTHMVVGLNVDASAGGTWKLSGYNKPLFPTGSALASSDLNINGRVYDYFYDSFGLIAEKLTPNCNIATLSSGINYCNGPFTYTGQSLPTGNVDWFINGDLRINSNLVLPSTTTIVFLVSGDVYIDNTVTQADGVYIVGQIFRTTRTDDDNMAAATLEIHGAVYGKDIRLGRILTGNNDLNPAERIIFDPKYYLLHSPYIGKPTVAWTEPKP